MGEGWSGDDTGFHQICFAALPDGRSGVQLDFMQLAPYRQLVMEIKGLRLNIGNDIFNNNLRTFYHQDGKEVIEGVGASKAIKTTSPWINIDDRLGAIGIFIPLLPTTPLLLLSAACYLRGSKRMHHWMLNNKWFGAYIRNYEEGKGIPLRTKVLIVTLLWIAISYSAYLVNLFSVQIILVAIAVTVSIHIVMLPTFRKP